MRPGEARLEPREELKRLLPKADQPDRGARMPGLTGERRQRMLEEPSVNQRLRLLITFLQDEIGSAAT